jgi:glycine hydroxymethyltransferase
MIYRLALDHFLVVVNASNNDKNWAWLNAVKNGEALLDAGCPSRRVTGAGACVLRDLRDPAHGAEMRVDVALQGPKSLDALFALGGTDRDKAAVKALPWAGITRATLGGFDLIVSRTGYTGERVAYELFVHPDQAAALFEALLGQGVTPCGLAARDSLRTEAGLPLYGHELAGDLGLNPADAGFANYVKLWKPFFIGKSAYIQHELQRDAVVTRFRLNNKVARPAHSGDPLVDRRGRVVGIVTSCAIDSEGYQLGQAYVKEAFSAEGTPVGVYSGSARAKALPVSGLKLGDKAPAPEESTILSRFPKRKK